MTARRAAPGRETGFSLLEVMVAVAIFALTVMTLFVVRGRAVEQAHLAKNIEIAQRYGKLLLEDVLLGNRIYTDGDSGTFEPPEAKDLTYEILVEEVTVAGTPPDEEEETDRARSRGAATVGGRRAKSSKMDNLFGDESGGGKRGKSASKEDEGLAADTEAPDKADEKASGSGKKKNKGGGGGGGGLFGEGEEQEPEILFRVTVKVHYPVLDNNETLTLETFVPPPPEEGEDEEESGVAGGKAGDKSKGGQGGKNGGEKGGGKKNRAKKGGGEDDLFGG